MITDEQAPLRVANCSGFYGDRLTAATEVVSGGPIDVLTGDWLAELTMGILHRQRRRRGQTRGEPGTPIALGALFGARSGDKAGNATLGLWARSDSAHEWLAESFDVETLRSLIPEFTGVELHPWALPNLRAVGVTAVGFLGEGVGSNLASDSQAKSLGEYVLSHTVDVPDRLLAALEALQ